MSLIRQVWLLLLFTLLLALLGSVSVNLMSARGYMNSQLQLKNSDNAVALALALSQQHGDRELMELLLEAQFDTGAYRQIGFTAVDGKPLFVRTSEQTARKAPAWFVRWVAIAPTPGLAQVSDGWRALGTVEVESSVAFAYDELWQGSLQAVWLLVAVGLLAGTLGTYGVLRIRRPLQAVVGQARALVDGWFETLPEPPVPELRSLTQAMNAMVTRLKATFEAQAGEVEQLRQQAHFDALTGLSNRGHFLTHVEAALQREDGAEHCGLVLLRLCDLDGVNRRLGRAAADRILAAIAETLRPFPDRMHGCAVGRLNGADFAIFLPVAGVVPGAANALSAALRGVLSGLDQSAAVILGAVELRRETKLARALADADESLARAEARGAFALEIAGEGVADTVGVGQDAWRHGLGYALAHGWARLVEFPLIDTAGELVHIECPMRMRVQPDGPFEPAARWLPLALRARLTAEIDLHAVALALAAIAGDGRQRCVNLAPASLADSAFAARLRKLVASAPREARMLWLEVAEPAAADQFELVRELVTQLRPLAVRVGLEHVGARLSQIDRLFDAAGLDFVKLDASVTRGTGADPQRANFVRGSVDLLHRLSIRVYAEGVNCDADARALWACGVDGMTGPWIVFR